MWVQNNITFETFWMGWPYLFIYPVILLLCRILFLQELSEKYLDLGQLIQETGRKLHNE